MYTPGTDGMTRVAAVDGVLEQANGFHEREVGALGLFRDLGDRYKEAEILTHLGDTYQAAGKTENAQTAWLEALEILSDFGHRDAELVRARLGSVTVKPR